MNSVALFDIDKTLINRSTAHLKAFFYALDDVYDVTAEQNVIVYHGMTDQQIIREVLKIKGLDKASIEAGLPHCMRAMVSKFNELNPSDAIELLPGVVELLTALSDRGITIGLVTGNLEEIAWAKLTKAGIAHYFTFGGFGSDHEDRKKMAAIALQRYGHLYKVTSGPDLVVLFGDTPFDIAAAHAIGAKAVGVATGHPSKEQLLDAGADIVLENLKDTQAVLRLVFDL